MIDELQLVEAHIREKASKLIMLGDSTSIVIAIEIEKIADEIDRITHGKPTNARKYALKQIAKSEDFKHVYVNIADEPCGEM